MARPVPPPETSGPTVFPPRSVSVEGGGFDRVGGSRLTGFGALLLLIIAIGAMSPPNPADRQLAAVVWIAFVGVFVIGAVVPMVLARRVRVEATSPRDVTVGDEVDIEVVLSGRCRGVQVRALDPTGPWHRANSPSVGSVVHLADRRGVFPAIRFEIRVTAPLGILACHRVHWVWLPVPVEIAPRATPMRWGNPKPIPLDGDAARFAGAPTGDMVRSVRPYVAGDPPRLVHWPSSARTGDLVVRELEPPTPVGLAVVLDLTGLGDRAEAGASLAMGACRAVLAAGGELVLATHEPSGPVAERVRTPLQAGRRLARAVDGPAAEPPEGWPVIRVAAE